MESGPKKQISTKALKVWRISGVIKSAVFWAIAAFLVFMIRLFNGPAWIPILLVGIGLILTYLLSHLLPSLRWKRWRYEVKEEEIELQQGIFIKTRTLIPMIRVQHVDTVQGPLLRKYGLASVIVNTAATSHEIPALEESEAEELRHFISSLARVADEDV
ncbi:MAG: PH domain-containing protein [Neobacillus sp.]